MENLKCNYCNYIPKTKYNYIRHLKSKKHLLNSGELDLEAFLESEMFENEHKMNKNEQNTHFCEYCFKTYKSRPSMVRHIKNFCKIKKEQDHQKELDKKEIEELKSQVNRLIDKVGSKVSNYTINGGVNKNNTLEIRNSNNHTQNIASQNIESQNIQLNNFGRENLGMLTDDIKKQMIKGPYGMFPKMMEMIYFNDKFPENKNIKLLNRKDDVLQIYDKDKGWKFVDKKETINDFLEDKGFEIDSYYDLNDNGFNNFAKKTYERFRELYEGDDKTLWNKIRKQIDLVLWNNMQ